MGFYFQCKKILFKLWDNIKNTKDEVIAGLIASISILCSFNDKNVSVSSLCNKLGIKMSTIQSQVKKRIFDEFKISGFTTLIKSTEILKNVMVVLIVKKLVLRSILKQMRVVKNQLSALLKRALHMK